MNKFVLLPYDIYKGLIQPIDYTSNNPSLEYARKAVERAKNEHSDDTTKNVHYNQEFRRYLHLKKEHDNKPIKVEIANAGKGAKKKITQSPSPPLSIPSRFNSPPQLSSHHSSLHGSIGSGSHTPLQQQQQPPASSGSAATFKSTQSDIPQTSDQNLTMQKATDALEDWKKQQLQETPTTSRSGAAKLGEEEQEKYDALIDAIQQNPASFSVSGNRILNKNGKHILGSDLNKSIQCIVAGRSGKWGEITPPGTKELESRLKRDPKTKLIIDSKIKLKKVKSTASTVALPTQQQKFKPALWKAAAETMHKKS